MQASGLVKDKVLPSAAAVAEYGYRAMMSGKTVAIHGRTNWILANASRLLPRNLVTAIVRRVSKAG